MKTIALVIRNFPGHEKKPVWFPISVEDSFMQGSVKEAEAILRESGEDVALTYAEDLAFVEKYNYTRI